MELKRWLTALFLTPLLILAIGFGSEAVFFGLILAATAIAINEFLTLILSQNSWKERLTAVLLGLLLAYGIFRGEGFLVLGILTFIIIFLLFFFLVSVRDVASVVPSLGKILAGIFYVGFLLPHFSLIRGMPFGKEWVFFVLVTTFMGDTGAYYAGSRLGKHKLYPKISPGKTIEGSIGGLIGSIGGALIFRKYFLSHIEVYHCVILALGLGIMGQLGDLCESMIKRSVGVKDSGHLLPGHGGILDRIDSIIFSAPFLYYYVFLIL